MFYIKRYKIENLQFLSFENKRLLIRLNCFEINLKKNISEQPPLYLSLLNFILKSKNVNDLHSHSKGP